jgi:hypothetical protein
MLVNARLFWVSALFVTVLGKDNGEWEKGQYEEDFNLQTNIKPMSMYAIAYDLELNPTGGSGMMVSLKLTNRQQLTRQRVSIALVKVLGVPPSRILQHLVRDKPGAMADGILDRYPTTESCFRDAQLTYMADGPLGPVPQTVELAGGGTGALEVFFRTDPALGDGTFALVFARCDAVQPGDENTWISVAGKVEWVPDWHINNKTWKTFFFFHFFVNGAILVYGIYCWYHYHEDEEDEPESSKPTPLSTVAPLPAASSSGSLLTPEDMAEGSLLGAVTSAPGEVGAAADATAPDPAADLTGRWALTTCTVGYAGCALLMKGCMLLRLLPGYDYVSERVLALVPCIGQDGRCSCDLNSSRDQVGVSGAQAARVRARGGVDCVDCGKAFAVACCCPVFALANVNSTAKLRTWPGTKWTVNVFVYASLFFGTSFALLIRYNLEEQYFSTLYNVHKVRIISREYIRCE